MSTVAKVNAALKALGEAPRLRHGRGYYFFDGPATAWPSSSVLVFRATELTVEEWLIEYHRLKMADALRRT